MPKQMMQQIPQFMNKKNLWKIGGGDLGLSIQSHLHLLIAAKLVIGSARSGSQIPGSGIRNPDPDPWIRSLDLKKF